MCPGGISGRIVVPGSRSHPSVICQFLNICTRQYSCHWPCTFFLLRKLKRLSPLFVPMLPNTSVPPPTLVIDHDHGILVVVVLFEAWYADESTPCLFSWSYQNLARLGFFYSLKAGVTGRFVERLRNKAVPLTHWLEAVYSRAAGPPTPVWRLSLGLTTYCDLVSISSNTEYA